MSIMVNSMHQMPLGAHRTMISIVLAMSNGCVMAFFSTHIQHLFCMLKHKQKPKMLDNKGIFILCARGFHQKKWRINQQKGSLPLPLWTLSDFFWYTTIVKVGHSIHNSLCLQEKDTFLDKLDSWEFQSTEYVFDN